MIKERILGLNRLTKTIIIMTVDYISIVLSFYISSWLLFKSVNVQDFGFLIVVYVPPLIAILFFYFSNLYQDILRFMHTGALFKLIILSFIYSILLGLLPYTLLIDIAFAVSLVAVNFLTLIFLLILSRLIARWFLVSNVKLKAGSKNIAIYGAGQAGVQIANALLYSTDLNPCVFIDDNQKLHNTKIAGIKIFPFEKIDFLIRKYQITELLFAIPSMSSEARKNLFSKLENLIINVKTLPPLSKILTGNVRTEDIRNIEIEDLLNREIVKPEENLLDRNINNKVVMVTGAGGSIGSEIARQVISHKPKKLILYESNEFSLYSIEKELSMQDENFSNMLSNSRLICVLGMLGDSHSLMKILTKFSVDTIYHAAAYKHVPIVENNPIQSVKNNIFGTLHLVKAAIECDVKNFVLISTDKAVRPKSIMGATKRFTEIILQAFSNMGSITSKSVYLHKQEIKVNKELIFSIVRFGNVLNSSGSVVPLFKEQIKKGGPVTVTDPNIVRYFMSIKEAVELVIQAGAMSKGGDIFVLDMGEPLTIADLAKKMIKLYGHKLANGDDSKEGIEIVYTGLRPGEKLFEELHIGTETQSTDHPKILKAKEKHLNLDKINNYLALLQKACEDQNVTAIYSVLKQAIPESKLQFPKKDTSN